MFPMPPIPLGAYNLFKEAKYVEKLEEIWC